MYIFLWFKDEIIFHRAKYICYFFFKEIQSGYPFHKITPNLKTAQVFPFDKKPWMNGNKNNFKARNRFKILLRLFKWDF